MVYNLQVHSCRTSATLHLLNLQFINIATFIFLKSRLLLVLDVGQDQVKESQLIDASRRSNHSQPVSQRVALQKLLDQVLDVLARELGVRNNGDLVARSGHGDLFAKVCGSAIDFDVFNQVLFEEGNVENVVVSVGNSVNDELVRN